MAEVVAEVMDYSNGGELPSSTVSITEKFAAINKIKTRDLNNYNVVRPYFYLFSKDDISHFLSDPYVYEDKMRLAVQYIYNASGHFRRLIQYFVGLSDLSYVVSPYKLDPKNANKRTTNINYRKVLNTISSMNIKTQFREILKVCLREDVYYGTMHVTNDSIILHQLPSKYCRISTIENGVPNVTFNFSYFDNSRNYLLSYYPEEFRIKYEQVYKNKFDNRWIELDSPTSFAIKCNSDILDYAIPPFAGVLREIYGIEDYKDLKLTHEQIDNYALLHMKIPMDSEGNWLLDYNKAEKFWRNLDAVLPELVGSTLSPMDIEKISFDHSGSDDKDTVAEAENSLYSSAGVSSLLFNNERASGSSLALSIKVDQALTFSIVQNIENMLNRYIQYQKFGKNFRVTFLDVSPFNRKEAAESYLKACQFGIPMISYYCAAEGLGQSEIDSMSYLETDVLELHKMFKPLLSSTQMSSSDIDSEAATDEGGAPTKDIEDLSESRESNKEAE